MAPPVRFEEQTAAVPDAVPRLRRAVVAFAREAGAPEEVLDDLALAVSEAATNAVLHAYVGAAPGPVRVTAELGRDALVVRVRDAGHGMRPRPDSPGLGLGLPTIGQLCQHIDIDAAPGGGTEICMVFRAPGVDGPSELPGQGDAVRRRLAGVVGALEEAVTVSDADGRIVFANDAAARLLGAAGADELLAAQPGEIFGRFISTHEDGTPLRPDEIPARQVFAGREPAPLLLRVVERATGRERWTRTTARLLDGEPPLSVNVVHDVTDEMRGQQRSALLERAGELLARTADPRQAFQEIARLAVPRLADWCVVDLVRPGGRTLDRVALAHRDPAREELGRELQRSYPWQLRDDEGPGLVLHTGEPLVIDEIADELLVQRAQDERHLEILRGLGFRSSVLLPMQARGELLGVLTLANAESERRFGPDDVTFALDLARRLASAL
ncbi:MAG TPA: ATP-binding protein [Baekduia sp.]|nr:ATP-binding protein [Baekduia sp.]